MGIPLRSLDGNKCVSVKQIRDKCIRLKSPIKFEIFFTNPRVFNNVRNLFLNGEVCTNTILSFLKYF